MRGATWNDDRARHWLNDIFKQFCWTAGKNIDSVLIFFICPQSFENHRNDEFAYWVHTALRLKVWEEKVRDFLWKMASWWFTSTRELGTIGFLVGMGAVCFSFQFSDWNDLLSTSTEAKLFSFQAKTMTTIWDFYLCSTRVFRWQIEIWFPSSCFLFLFPQRKRA